MPSIEVGQTVSVRCPLDSSITVTPGAAGTCAVSVQSIESPSFQAQVIGEACTFSVVAGDRVTISARGASATYTDPAFTAAEVRSVQAMVSRAGNPPRQHGFYVFEGRIAATHTPDAASGTTYSAVFTLPIAVDAVEPIFANGGGSAYTVTAMSAAAIPDDGSDINGNSQTLTVGSVTGKDTVPASPGTSQPGLLLGNRMLLANPNGYRSVMVRCHLPNTAGSVTMMGSGAGGTDSFTNWATRSDERVSFRAQTGNQTATAGAFTSTTQVSYCPIIGVKFYARGVVYTIMLTGDSIDSGRGTYRADGPVRQAIRNMARSGYAVSVANLAWAGSSSTNNRGTAALAFAAGLVPDMLIRSGASPNDTGGAISDATTVQAWRAAAAESRAACAQYGVECAFRTGIPANHAGDTPAGSESWGATDSLLQAWNTELLAQRARGVRVWDWWSVVAGTVGPGGNVTFAPGMTSDGTHPSDEGNAAIAAAMAASGLLP